MKFMNSSLEKLVKNLADDDFKQLTEDFGSENLQLLKQNGAYPYQYMNSFDKFNEENLLSKEWFFGSTKKGKIGDDSKKLNEHKTDEKYIECKKIWNKFGMKNMGDYHGHYLKKGALLLADEKKLEKNIHVLIN